MGEELKWITHSDAYQLQTYLHLKTGKFLRNGNPFVIL